MKKGNRSRSQDEMLAKYLSGELTGDQLKDFTEKIYTREENPEQIDRLKTHWTAMKEYPSKASPDPSRAWKKLQSRLRDERLIPVREKETGNRISFNFIRIAAAALILLGVVAVLLFYPYRRPQSKLVHLSTGTEENTLIKTLNDGTIIYLARNSRFTFPEKFRSGARNVMLRGEAFFDVAPDPRKPFVIDAGEVMVRVVGTAFNIRMRSGDKFNLVVDRGKVEVFLKKDPSDKQGVTAGEQISAVNHILVKSRLPGGNKTWYRHRMHFRDEPLTQILEVLNRNFNTNFAVSDMETGKHKLTVTFQDETPETMAMLICTALDLKSQKINGSVVFSGKTKDTRKN